MLQCEGHEFKSATTATPFTMDNHRCYLLDTTEPEDLGEHGHYLTQRRTTAIMDINGEGTIIGVAFPL